MDIISLIDSHPQIARDWNYNKSGSLRPENVTANSRDRIWWRCTSGHEYQVSVFSRVRSNGCKICHISEKIKKQLSTKLSKSQSLFDHSPQLENEWDYSKNEGVDPQMVSFGSNLKVWWKCINGHSWSASIKMRVRGRGCRLCSDFSGANKRRLKSVTKAGQSFAEAYPELLKQWDFDKNLYSPFQISPRSSYRASWRCQYGHSWEATVTNRTYNNSGCPECNPQSSRVEIYLLCEIRSIFSSTKWRYLIDGTECDIYIPDIKIGIEVDGYYWHQKKIKKDIEKNLYFSKRGIVLVRVRDSALPKIEGHQIHFGRNDDLQDVANRLIKYLIRFEKSFKRYSFTQQANSTYKEMIAKLPAPPDGESLLDSHPVIAAEWDYEKNYPLVPELFSKGSNQKFSWICSGGHRFMASINNRVMKSSGCPVCYESKRSDIVRNARLKKTKSLQQLNPIYLKMYDNEKNELTPSDIAIKSNIDIWWKCQNGHSFKKKPNYMVSNHDCPVCNTLFYKWPSIAAEWHPTLNEQYDIHTIHSGSSKKIWWRCDKGHEWKTAVVNRTRGGTGCPQCFKIRRSKS